MIDGSEKRKRQLAFELQNSHECEKRSNVRDVYFPTSNLLYEQITLRQMTTAKRSKESERIKQHYSLGTW